MSKKQLEQVMQDLQQKIHLLSQSIQKDIASTEGTSTMEQLGEWLAGAQREFEAKK